MILSFVALCEALCKLGFEKCSINMEYYIIKALLVKGMLKSVQFSKEFHIRQPSDAFPNSIFPSTISEVSNTQGAKLSFSSFDLQLAAASVRGVFSICPGCLGHWQSVFRTQCNSVDYQIKSDQTRYSLNHNCRRDWLMHPGNQLMESKAVLL